MEQFTFYELYADILQSMDDVSAGKLASCICAYEFEDKEPAGELSDRENLSKNICKNRKQNNRVRGGKLGRICSRIRKTQSLLHPAFLLSDAGNPPSVCLRQNLYEEEKQ